LKKSLPKKKYLKKGKTIYCPPLQFCEQHNTRERKTNGDLEPFIFLNLSPAADAPPLINLSVRFQFHTPPSDLPAFLW
jgi:hypothetical protein